MAPAVRTFARRRLRTDDAVQEFTQDVMLVLLQALRERKIEDPGHVAGFVLGICRNLALDRVRQRERRQALWSQYSADLAGLDMALPKEPSYEVMHLEDCLSSLSLRAREVLRLSYVEAQSHDEIARSLTLSEANARVLRHRSLRSLRECMSKRISWEVA